jgi:hypothetical protein
MAFGRPRLVRRIRESLGLDEFAQPEHRRLAELLFAREEHGESIRAADLARPECDPELASFIAALAADVAEGGEDAALDLIAALSARRRRAEIARLRELIREHEAAGRREEVAPLLERIQSLLRPEPPATSEAAETAATSETAGTALPGGGQGEKAP